MPALYFASALAVGAQYVPDTLRATLLPPPGSFAGAEQHLCRALDAKSRTFGIKACPEWSTDLTNWFVSGEDPPGANTPRTITLTQTGTLNGLPQFTAQLPRNGSPRLWLRLKLRRE